MPALNTATKASRVEILIALIPSMARSVSRYLPPLVEKQNLHCLMMGIEQMNGGYDGACSPDFPQVPTVNIDTTVGRNPSASIIYTQMPA
jgi:hypothetical protein